MILVLGFGTFEGVRRNPAERLAGMLDGRRVGGHTIVGRRMPVSYRRCVGLTKGLARRLNPALVLGIGVATERTEAQFEVRGANRVSSSRPDVDGESPATLEVGGPEFRHAGFPGPHISGAGGVGFSENAGDYVCNAWLYRVLGQTPALRVGFLHIPSTGYEAEPVLATLLEGLGSKI